MATIVPVPLLSLYTANMLERAVCGSEEINLQLLKKVVRYVDTNILSSMLIGLNLHVATLCELLHTFLFTSGIVMERRRQRQ